MKRLIIVILALILLNGFEQKSFPKILWTFLDDGYEYSNNYAKLCINSMENTAKESGYQFRFLTAKTAKELISQEHQSFFNEIIALSKDKIQGSRLKDLLQLFILYRFGGFWVDSNIFFLKNLDWLNKLQDIKEVYNKIGKNPEIFTFTQNSKIGRSQYRGTTYLYPGVQIWALAAQPKSIFILDWIKTIHFFNKIGGVQNAIEYCNKNGYQFGTQFEGEWLTNSWSAQFVLQKKQRDFDLNGGQFRYAVQYYKMWSMDENTSIRIFIEFQWNSLQAMKKKQLSYFQTTFQIQLFFVKSIQQIRRVFERNIKAYVEDENLKFQNQIYEQSLLYQYLIKPSLEKEPQLVNSFIRRKKSEKIDKKYNESKNILLFGIFALFFVPFTWFLADKLYKSTKDDLIDS